MGQSGGWPLGTKFIRYSSKRRDIETIVDIHTTTNNSGKVVSVKYVTSHDLMGQTVKDYTVPAALIARSEILLDAKSM